MVEDFEIDRAIHNRIFYNRVPAYGPDDVYMDGRKWRSTKTNKAICPAYSYSYSGAGRVLDGLWNHMLIESFNLRQAIRGIKGVPTPLQTCEIALEICGDDDE